MTYSDEDVERAARAIFEDGRQRDPCDGSTFDNSFPEAQEELRRMAQAVLSTLTTAKAWTAIGWKLVPEEPTDEMIRASLATDLPATFRNHLRHPNNGKIAAKDTEIRIAHERKRYAAVVSAAPEPEASNHWRPIGWNGPFRAGEYIVADASGSKVCMAYSTKGATEIASGLNTACGETS